MQKGFCSHRPPWQREVMADINQIPKGQQTPYSLTLRLLDRSSD